MENSSRAVEERRYVHLDPETVTNIAESLGISNLAPGVAKELAQDVTYRLREISDVCSQFLRHSRSDLFSCFFLNSIVLLINVLFSISKILKFLCLGKENCQQIFSTKHSNVRILNLFSDTRKILSLVVIPSSIYPKPRFLLSLIERLIL